MPRLSQLTWLDGDQTGNSGLWLYLMLFLDSQRAPALSVCAGPLTRRPSPSVPLVLGFALATACGGSDTVASGHCPSGYWSLSSPFTLVYRSRHVSTGNKTSFSSRNLRFHSCGGQKFRIRVSGGSLYIRSLSLAYREPPSHVFIYSFFLELACLWWLFFFIWHQSYLIRAFLYYLI